MDRSRFSTPKGSPWADWLADDPPPEDVQIHRPQSAFASSNKERAQEAVAAPLPTVSIQIAVPKVRLPKLPYKRIGLGMAVVVVAIGLSIGGVMLTRHLLHKNKGIVKGTTTEEPLSFTPVVPQDRPELAGGNDPEKNAYDPQRKLYSFKDTLMGFGVTVSQQEVPESFKKDTNNLKKAAESMEGKLIDIETAFGKAYISTPAKGEGQHVVFIYQDRLVFLTSYKNFDNETWKYYIETLR